MVDSIWGLEVQQGQTLTEQTFPSSSLELWASSQTTCTNIYTQMHIHVQVHTCWQMLASLNWKSVAG